MRTHRQTVLSALLIGVLHTASAQQEVMVSQYMFNGLFLNPAYAGSHPYASGSLLHREQWTDVAGAPSTSMLAFDSPLMGDKMGLGFTMVHDRIGVSRDLQMDASYAYNIRTSETGRLAFGLKAGLSLYSANLSELVYWDVSDAVFQTNVKNQLVGKFGFGLYWHNDRSYLGLSVPTIYAADKKLTAIAGTTFDHYFTQHYYFNAGHVFPINEYFDVKPSVLVKYQAEAPMEVDINCNVLYKDRFWLGVGYRTGDAVVGMLEYQVNRTLRLGYAYDLTISDLSMYSGGSHEVMLGVDLGKDPIKIKTPRYF